MLGFKLVLRSLNCQLENALKAFYCSLVRFLLENFTPFWDPFTESDCFKEKFKDVFCFLQDFESCTSATRLQLGVYWSSPNFR